MSSIKKAFHFWTLRWTYLEVNWPQICTLSLLVNISTRPKHLLIQNIPNVPLFFSQALRVSRICYNKIDFERHLYNIKSWFQARSYPKHLTQNEMSKPRFNKENRNTKHITLFWNLFRVWLIIIWIFYTLMKILKKFLCLDPW